MSRRPWPLLLAVPAVAVLVGVAAIAYLRFGAMRSRLPESGVTRLAVSGLKGPVTVRMDTAGVPHIAATCEWDLWLAQGYLHARDRFFQMELARRAAAGRLAELAGEGALATDRKLRTWRIAATAWRQAGKLDSQERQALDAYAAGVNAALTTYGRWIAPEMRLLGLEPEPWRREDTLGIGILFQLSLTWSMGEELERGVELARLGRQRAVELWGWTPQQAADWIPPGTPPAEPRQPDEDAITRSLGGVGSNNWAIAGTRTVSGRPLVANDPHIGVQMPGTWYGVHLAGAGFDVAGVSIPGAPGVVIGHNRRVAWGFTMVMLDDQDLFVVKADRDRRREFFGGQWVPLRTLTERVRIRGRPDPARVEIRISRSGPVVRDDAGEVLALAWTALKGGTPLGAFLRMDRAAGVDETATAWRGVVGPALNLVAADVEGHILHQVVGRVPIRGRGAGRLPAPGDNPQWQWQGFRAMAANPRVVDPPQGFLATANHDLFTEGDYPSTEWFPAEFAPPWRVRRIRGLLAARDRWDVASCVELQGDLVSRRAGALLELLRPELERNGGPTARQLLDWDGNLRPETVAPHVYSRLVLDLCRAVGEDEAQSIGLKGTLITPERLVRLLAGGLPAEWWDDLKTPQVEDRGAIVGSVLKNLDDLHIDSPWGSVHTVEFPHPLGDLPTLGPLLGASWSRGPIAVGGDGATVNAHYWELDEPYRVSAIPSMRFVADVGAWDESILVLPVGNSGRPWSGHYDDQLSSWVRVEPVRLPFSEKAVEAAARATLQMAPSTGR